MIRWGFHPVREALRHQPQAVRRVFVGRGRGGARRSELEALCRRQGVELREVEAGELERLAPGVHNGFVAELAAESRAEPATQLARHGDADLLVLVEDIQDPRNLGALLRVCEGAGVGAVAIRDRGSAPLSPVAGKASAGASEWLPLERITNSSRQIEEWKKQGYWVYGLAAGGVPPWEVDLTGRVVLCLGGEEKGLRTLTRNQCDRLLGLPMRGQVESLNVVSAAAAVLYEAVRQRSTAGAAPSTGTVDRPNSLHGSPRSD